MTTNKHTANESPSKKAAPKTPIGIIVGKDSLDLDALADRDDMVIKTTPSRSPKDAMHQQWAGDLEDRVMGGDHTEDAAEHFRQLSSEINPPADQQSRSNTSIAGFPEQASALGGTERQKLRQLLEERKQDLETSLAELTRQLQEELVRSDRPHIDYNHPADGMEGDEERERYLNLIKQQEEELRQVADALHRFSKKSFGLCQACGDQISNKRLQAIPFAPFCRSCQIEAEQDQARWGRTSV